MADMIWRRLTFYRMSQGLELHDASLSLHFLHVFSWLSSTGLQTTLAL